MYAFPFLCIKLFYFARLSPAKSEQPVNVYWIILQVGVIKGWKNEWATLEATEAVLVAKEQAFLAVNPTQLQFGLNIQGLKCLLLSKACLDGVGTGIEGPWAGLRVLWLCFSGGGDFSGDDQGSALVPNKQWISFPLSENSPPVFFNQHVHCKVTVMEESAGMLQGLDWGFTQTIWGAEVQKSHMSLPTLNSCDDND